MISLNEFYRFYTNNLFNAAHSRYSNFILYKRKCEILSYFCFLREGGGRGEGDEEGRGEGMGGGKEGHSWQTFFDNH